ncbi:MAG: segregation/condensation protein A [Candidatus Latescibacteria bacterium]|nr:segregation/condensation protein A [Candidatus Latescibacterota bacterium]
MTTIPLSTPDQPSKPGYQIKLEVFEGPLDLLLYLIRKEELDIYDIPVAHITAQYLAFLEQIRRFNIEQAGEFILMAATLMRLKSQMLLPRDENAEDMEEDPRDELVRRLLEYQQFKEIADWLGGQGKEQEEVFHNRPGQRTDEVEQGQLQPVSLFDLLKMYQHVLETVPEQLVHQVLAEEVKTEECIEHILAVLERRSRTRFFDIVQGQSRAALIATFVALLELLKNQQVRAQQASPFSDIWIEPNEGAPQPMEVSQTP